MTQAGIGASYVRNIINQEIETFLQKSSENSFNPKLVTRYKYNQNLTGDWFGSINEIIKNVDCDNHGVV